mgnify:CR=1 FL=1
MKTLKLKKDVVSRLDREQSAMVKGGAGQTTIIPATNYCAGTQKNCATKDQLGLCVSATTCKSDNVIACVEPSKQVNFRKLPLSLIREGELSNISYVPIKDMIFCICFI